MRKIALITATVMMTVGQVGTASAVPFDAGNPAELGMKRKCAPGSKLRACQKRQRTAAVRKARPHYRPSTAAETAAANQSAYVPPAQPAPAPAPAPVQAYTPPPAAPAPAGLPFARHWVELAAFTAFGLGLVALLTGRGTSPRGPIPVGPPPTSP